MITWQDLLAGAEQTLRDASVMAPDTEARWMLEEVSGLEPAELVVHGADPASRLGIARLDSMLERRTHGEPLQYVLGEWQFRGLDLLVDPRVLIPRPETEVTAQATIDEAVRLGERTGRADPWAAAATTFTAVDLGTGSGAIVLTLASELPDVEVWGTDVSEDALAVARSNLAGIGYIAARVRLVHGSWFDVLPDDLRGRIRIVVSNPPYVAAGELEGLAQELRHEPVGALVSGPTGLEAIAAIVGQAPEWLEPTGTLVCEIAPHQAEAARDLASRAGFGEVEVRHDFTGRERVLVARRAG